MPAYSGKSVVEKLGLEDGTRWAVRHAPADVFEIMGPVPAEAERLPADSAELDLVLLFVTRAAVLEVEFAVAAQTLQPAGMLWVAWPKRASKVPTDLTGDVVRAIGLAAGLVDVKVCAVSSVWSGLKFVRRVADRPAAKRTPAAKPRKAASGATRKSAKSATGSATKAGTKATTRASTKPARPGARTTSRTERADG